VAYKEGNCCKCDMPIVVQSFDWSESNNYCVTCAYDKMDYVPSERNDSESLNDDR
jgi:hypothetical protein